MSPKSQRMRVALAAFAAGALALLAQSLLLREELLLYGGNEIAVGAFLGLWLAGIAVGALAVRRFAADADRLTVPLLVGLGLLPLAAVVLARLARDAAGVPAYEPFPLTGLLLWSIPVAVPVALATGALVPSLAARARAFGGSVTEIYVFEALGAFLGAAGAAREHAGVDREGAAGNIGRMRSTGAQVIEERGLAYADVAEQGYAAHSLAWRLCGRGWSIMAAGGCTQ